LTGAGSDVSDSLFGLRIASEAAAECAAPCFAIAEARRVAAQDDRAAAAASAVAHGLRASNDGDFVVGVERRVQRWRIHAVGAAAVQIGAIEQNVQPRLALAANDGVDAASAHA
jgi:hypothetical protein